MNRLSPTHLPLRFATCLLFVAITLASSDSAAADEIFVDAGRGPVRVFVPSTYDPAEPMPLIMLLHGYTSSGSEMEAWWRLEPLAEELGFFYLTPNGTRDIFGFRFWNATDACCDLFGSGVDDSAYLRTLIELIRTQLSVDAKSIHITGHSNGGFMSYRMACDHADIVASIASLAGATFLDPSDCMPSEPVHALQIHGTSDDVILYNGGCIGNGCYPGAVQTAETWAMYDGCAIIADDNFPPLDLDAGIGGSETDVVKYLTDCLPGGSAELWTINNGEHSPNLSPQFGRLVVTHLLSHRKPAESDVAVLTNIEMLTGVILSGGLPELLVSDDTHVRARSGFGQTFIDLHHMEMQVSAVTTAQSPTSLDLTIESRIDEPSGTAQVRLFDHNTQTFDLVRQYAIGSSDAMQVIADLDAGDYVSQQGEIELRIKHIVFVPFLAFTFESWIDLVEIAVR